MRCHVGRQVIGWSPVLACPARVVDPADLRLCPGRQVQRHARRACRVRCRCLSALQRQCEPGSGPGLHENPQDRADAGVPDSIHRRPQAAKTADVGLSGIGLALQGRPVSPSDRLSDTRLGCRSAGTPRSFRSNDLSQVVGCAANLVSNQPFGAGAASIPSAAEPISIGSCPDTKPLAPRSIHA